MAINIDKFTIRLKNLKQRKQNIEMEYSTALSKINEEIEEERKLLNKVVEILNPYICKTCDGSGEERYTDAAGSRDYRKCRICNGTGISTD